MTIFSRFLGRCATPRDHVGIRHLGFFSRVLLLSVCCCHAVTHCPSGCETLGKPDCHRGYRGRASERSRFFSDAVASGLFSPSCSFVFATPHHCHSSLERGRDIERCCCDTHPHPPLRHRAPSCFLTRTLVLFIFLLAAQPESSPLGVSSRRAQVRRIGFARGGSDAANSEVRPLLQIFPRVPFLAFCSMTESPECVAGGGPSG